jgi:uncharacterized protein (UPF0332 family)
MNEEVRLHLERAEDCIKDTELLLSGNRNFAAVSRVNYTNCV